MKNILPLILILLILPVTKARACRCSPPPSALQSLVYSDAVFSGEVISIIKYENYAEVSMQVKESWKTIDSSVVIIRTGFTSCDWIFEEGKEYLVYGLRHEIGYYVTNLCTRTTLLESAVADLAELGEGLVSSACLDLSRIDKNVICTLEFQPVCGCDGNTYGNICLAEKNGITCFTEGECE